MKVLKFGGTSVANATSIKKVLDITDKEKGALCVVVSALGGITDLLIEAGTLASGQNEDYRKKLQTVEKRHLEVVKELMPVKVQSRVISEVKRKINHLETLLEGVFLLSELSSKTTDMISGYGELLSSFIIYEAAKNRGMDIRYGDSRDLIRTWEQLGKTLVDMGATHTNCQAFWREVEERITLIPGFIASNSNGKTTTLGRGGSDHTAALVAAALDANELQIWTDVNGMFTADPKLVRQARPIANITYQEAMELSHFGAKVIYPPTIQPILEKKIPIHIRNTFDPEANGTYITESANGESKPVKGISHIGEIALITLEGSGMVGIPGFSKRLFEALYLANINIILITQASSEHSICMAVSHIDAVAAKEVVDATFKYEIDQGEVNPVVLETGQAIIALVGEHMKSHQGLSGRMFSTLGKNNVNIRAIAQGASEKNISAVIDEADVRKALNSLHEHFFEENIKQLNLFVTGVGNVGEKFLHQIHKQEDYLKKKLRLNPRVVGISNSKTMVFDEEGIDLTEWRSRLVEGEKADPVNFFEKAKALNLRNSIFLDNTASETISKMYEHYLSESISVVTCNKIACSWEFEAYQKLKDLSREYGAPFLFETNVGAGLPIIDTLQNLIASGDMVHKIEAVLSGSLNFIFDNYNTTIPFHQVVREAMREGYTEPDPKIDLSGVDVARKILILVRESKYNMEMEDIENIPFIPKKSWRTTTNEAFFDSLEKYEEEFVKLYNNAADKGCRIKYVAEFNDGKARVGLQHINWGHEFYNLEGKDNIVIFHTDRYSSQPLIVKGAGAGADVTASGIFADVIRVGKR